MVAQIATASNQQSDTAGQINQNVEQIARITNESSVGVQEAAKACENLSNLALELQQIVSRFKVDDGHGRSSTKARNGKTPGNKQIAHRPAPPPMPQLHHTSVSDAIPDYYSNPSY